MRISLVIEIKARAAAIDACAWPRWMSAGPKPLHPVTLCKPKEAVAGERGAKEQGDALLKPGPKKSFAAA
ncbi:MAG: hypothetical protein RR718_09725 [Comamonas sp.]